MPAIIMLTWLPDGRPSPGSERGTRAHPSRPPGSPMPSSFAGALGWAVSPRVLAVDGFPDYQQSLDNLALDTLVFVMIEVANPVSSASWSRYWTIFLGISPNGGPDGALIIDVHCALMWLYPQMLPCAPMCPPDASVPLCGSSPFHTVTLFPLDDTTHHLTLLLAGGWTIEKAVHDLLLRARSPARLWPAGLAAPISVRVHQLLQRHPQHPIPLVRLLLVLPTQSLSPPASRPRPPGICTGRRVPSPGVRPAGDTKSLGYVCENGERTEDLEEALVLKIVIFRVLESNGKMLVLCTEGDGFDPSRVRFFLSIQKISGIEWIRTRALAIRITEHATPSYPTVRAARDVYGQPAAPQEELEAIPKDMGRTGTVPPPRPRSRSRSPSGSPQPAAHIPLSMREALRAATGGTDVPIYNADDTNGLYRSARESCAALQQAIAHCAESATRAYLNHDGKAAHEYSRKARELRAKLRPEQERAFNTIFTARNEHLRDSYAIDLHGLHVNEALGVLEAHFQLMRDAPEHPPRVILITGRGSHSRGHARLVPAVEAFLQGQRAHYSFNPDGFFISLFHLKRGVLQSILQSVDVERNPLFITPPVATAFSPNSTAQCSVTNAEIAAFFTILIEKRVSLQPQRDRFHVADAITFGAPVVLYVTTPVVPAGYPSTNTFDAGVYTTYLLLAAEELGLAACPVLTVMADDPSHFLERKLGITPGTEQIQIAISLGYPHPDYTNPPEYTTRRTDNVVWL
ncbi:hypothetical protein PAPYR_5050 [Paratrimastix pyriformis]|uniref:Smr domain-containing protein n=1 Tax=Paratrimastix pyriformis TaxID=342808 RepID=A0ABQ8ULZ6_9EUKA|nr:hypothetical protein PAPYR_5050 [Paratrimastix pyriformis]